MQCVNRGDIAETLSYLEVAQVAGRHTVVTTNGVKLVRTLLCQLEDTFQLIVTHQGMELVMVHIEVISQCFKKYRVEYKARYTFLLDTIQL